ncbi:MAG: hypothetical protein KDB36_01070 [Acidimicrobiales bacterium]|nr:hypothetical protein [Acidimicrobiales bacterium]
MTDARAHTLAAVLAKGHLRLDEPVQLRSGAYSRDFLDAKRALASGDDLRVACEAIVALLADAGVTYDAVGGLTMGADQFAHGIAVVTGCDWFVVRKEAKGRGTNQLVEGAVLDADTRVVLLEDVVTTGGSMHQAYQRVVDLGAEVVAAVTLVDRGDDAAGFFADRSVPYLPLLTYRDLGIDPVVAPA